MDEHYKMSHPCEEIFGRRCDENWALDRGIFMVLVLCELYDIGPTAITRMFNVTFIGSKTTLFHLHFAIDNPTCFHVDALFSSQLDRLSNETRSIFQ